MRKLLVAAVIGLCAVFIVPTGAWAAPTTGPQPMPDAACNQGTVNARANTPTEARDFVPHFHDFNLNWILACYHANPTYPVATPDLE